MHDVNRLISGRLQRARGIRETLWLSRRKSSCLTLGGGAKSVTSLGTVLRRPAKGDRPPGIRQIESVHSGRPVCGYARTSLPAPKSLKSGCGGGLEPPTTGLTIRRSVWSRREATPDQAVTGVWSRPGWSGENRQRKNRNLLDTCDGTPSLKEGHLSLVIKERGASLCRELQIASRRSVGQCSALSGCASAC